MSTRPPKPSVTMTLARRGLLTHSLIDSFIDSLNHSLAQWLDVMQQMYVLHSTSLFHVGYNACILDPLCLI
jgi:hypothetical protein